MLSILNINPFIQYQNESKLCIKLGNELKFILDNNNILNNKKKEGILLLTDRGIDPSSPLFHNDNYISLCYDLLNDIEINKDNKIKLSKEDELWNKIKLMNINSVSDELLKCFEEYTNKDNNNLSFIEMINYLKDLINKQDQNYIINIPKVKCLINQLYLAEEIRNKYKENNFNELIEFEKNILLNEINTELSSKILEIKQNILREDYLRLLLILYINNAIKDIFNEQMINNDISKEENNIFNNLKYIIKNNTNDNIKLIINNEYESNLFLIIKKAFELSLKKNWQGFSKFAILTTDAPCHGKEFYEGDIEDNYPEGDPEHRDIKEYVKEKKYAGGILDNSFNNKIKPKSIFWLNRS